MTCQSSEVHQDDVGTIFRMTLLNGTTAMDLSTATTKQFSFKKPSGAVITKTASFYTDGTDGVIQYTVEAGVLNETGEWQWQAYIANPVGSWRSDIESFRVYKNIGA